MIRTEQIEILFKLRPEIIDLKFTRTENDPYWTELNPNIFFLIHFSFQEKYIEPKINWPETEPTRNRTWTESCWPEMTRSEPEPNNPFARSRCKPGKITKFQIQNEKLFFLLFFPHSLTQILISVNVFIDIHIGDFVQIITKNNFEIERSNM